VTFAEHLGRATRRHHGRFIDEEAGPCPVAFGMAHEFEPANTALHDLDVFAVPLEHAACGWYAG